ncbi:MAG: phage integrase N-terminal SAM-like domain-containing protein [Chloroflexi bacterium]|nr:phage integrase N-terminal SAM-like domain-containing protein [Chloroflexota bacterium]
MALAQPGGSAIATRISKLMDRLREALRSCHYRCWIEETYCMWVKRFIFFHEVRHPAEMARQRREVNVFLTPLAMKEKVRALRQSTKGGPFMYHAWHYQSVSYTRLQAVFGVLCGSV